MATLICPVPSCAISPGGDYGASRVLLGLPPHTGVDFPVRTGTVVRAPLRGVVVRTWTEGTGGRMLELAHTDRLSTRYAHLGSITVRAGQVVEAGAAIAFSGSSGFTTGPHLHFEVWADGRHVDPKPYLGVGVATTGRSAGLSDAPDVTIYPSAGCRQGYRPVRVGGIGPIGGAEDAAIPVPFLRGYIEAIGEPGQAGNWNVCVRADIPVQVGGDLFSVASIGREVAEEVKEGLFSDQDLTLLANVGILVAGVLIGWGGVRRILEG